MIRVYVAGPYSADNVIDVLQNIGKGEFYASELFQKGYAPFCPWHDRHYIMRNWALMTTVRQCQEASMAWLEVSDVVYVIPGYESSMGTQREIARAHELKIPVVYSMDDIEEAACGEWIRHD